MVNSIKVKYDKKTHKRCIKCRTWKPKVDDPEKGLKRQFGKHGTSADGVQSICYACKNNANKEARNRDTGARLKHHTATRVVTQLGSAAPKGITKDLEKYIGYRFRTLARHLRDDLRSREGPDRKLRDALNEGYHIDHIKPLSSFQVILEDGTVDWEEFKRCWAMDNLTAIPAQENLQKGAKYDGVD